MDLAFVFSLKHLMLGRDRDFSDDILYQFFGKSIDAFFDSTKVYIELERQADINGYFVTQL